MKIVLVISDSHGNSKELETLINSHSFDYVFFLGDTLNDIQGVNHNNLSCVRGNWDLDIRTPIEAFVTIENAKIMITHGHKYRVKSGLGALINTAKSEKCDFVCYGHTHTQKYEKADNIGILNPGAFSNFKGGDYSYAVLEIDGKKINVNMSKFLK